MITVYIITGEKVGSVVYGLAKSEEKALDIAANMLLDGSTVTIIKARLEE